MKYLLFLLLLWTQPVLATPSHPIDHVTGTSLCRAVLDELLAAADRGDIGFQQAHHIHLRCLDKWGYD